MNRTRSSDSDDIERAVYDGMQDLRVRTAPLKGRAKASPKPKKRRPRRRK